MQEKIKVGIVFGGRSAEHEVSIQSARNIVSAIDKNKYEVIEIKIEKDGNLAQLLNVLNKNKNIVIFPILHGPFGEDGTVQGMLKLMNVPFVGSSVLGSAIGMDKEVAYRLLRDAGLPIVKFITLTKTNKKTFEDLKKKLGFPFFIKPASLGSSIGMHKVKSKKEFDKAIKDAFKYDNKVLAEEFIKGREIECSVLGNENPIASIVGEIVISKNHEFYSYEAKYIDKDGAALVVPAKLTKEQLKRTQDLSVRAFKILECEGMGRIDFFLKENGEVIFREINTIPGFTNISMYPKLWEKSGISYTELITRLITLAIKRFKRDQKLKTTV